MAKGQQEFPLCQVRGLPLWSPGGGSPCWPHSRGFCPWKGEVFKESPEAEVGRPTQKRADRSPPSLLGN